MPRAAVHRSFPRQPAEQILPEHGSRGSQIGIATILALALTAASASPQIWDGGYPVAEPQLPTLIPAPADGTRDIRESIRDGRKSGQLDRKEARALRRETRAIEAIGARLAEDGLSDSEAREITVRTEAERGLVDARRLRGD